MPTWLKNLIGGPLKAELAKVAALLTADAPALEAEAAASEQTAAAFLEAKVTSLVSANPVVSAILALVESDFAPELNALLTKLEGQGIVTVDKLIPEVAAWLVAEEADV